MVSYILGVDPGRVTGMALIKVDGSQVTLVEHITFGCKKIGADWPTYASYTAGMAIGLISRVEGLTPRDVTISMELPVFGPSAASLSVQCLLCGAIVGRLLGYDARFHFPHPLHSKRALIGTGRAPRGIMGERVTEKTKKEPMVKMCKLRKLWPKEQPKTQAEQWALADAIAHGLAAM